MKPRRKLLIVEPNLIENSGHHHTQVAALQRLLPEFDMRFVAGASYNGFLGQPVALMNPTTMKHRKILLRVKYGPPFRRLISFFRLLPKMVTRKLPRSTFGSSILQANTSLGLGEDDIIVIPSADLDALESAVEVSSSLAERSPQICLRFLTPDMGEGNIQVRRQRLSAIMADAGSRIKIFSETNELAEYLNAEYGLQVTGGFYLPCSMEMNTRPELSKINGTFRIGVLGLPKSRKGSSLIPQIVVALDSHSRSKTAGRFEFVVQGTANDFGPSGVYGSLIGFMNCEKHVTVSPLCASLSPAEFSSVFKTLDVVLLPYDKDIYGLQGSGVIQDAVMAYKPILHSSGLSMADLLCHGNAISATSLKEYAEAILYIVHNPLQFKQATAKAAMYYGDYLRKHPLIKWIHEGSGSTL